MLINVSHEQGISSADEILFNTPFGYMFPQVINSDKCYLREGKRTYKGLLSLGKAMADPGDLPDVGDAHAELDSAIPAAYTYLGQFIDHDITARTDRDNAFNNIAPDQDGPITPLDTQDVVANLRNGRRPQLDLDSMYGDGPGLIDGVTTAASSLFDNQYAFEVNEKPGGYIDLRRDKNLSGKPVARIADMRNDENVMISQLHARFLKFHNKVLNNPRRQLSGTSDEFKFTRTRQLVRWAYQFVVINDYLPRVCDPAVVDDILRNGPRFFSPASSGEKLFMPLEFSAAGFRFGHSMIRPFYQLNNDADKIRIDKLLEANSDSNTNGDELLPERVIDWDLFVNSPNGDSVQKARKIDPKIAKGLFKLPFGNCDPILADLARRNLLRAYLLKIPTGQACSAAMGVVPLGANDLLQNETSEIQAALIKGKFTDRTPLWYYVLKESSLQKQGETLGAVGSRIVAETIIGLVKQDQNSYLNNTDDPAVKLSIADPGIDVKEGRGGKIKNLEDLINF